MINRIREEQFIIFAKEKANIGVHPSEFRTILRTSQSTRVLYRRRHDNGRNLCLLGTDFVYLSSLHLKYKQINSLFLLSAHLRSGFRRYQQLSHRFDSLNHHLYSYCSQQTEIDLSALIHLVFALSLLRRREKKSKMKLISL